MNSDDISKSDDVSIYILTGHRRLLLKTGGSQERKVVKDETTHFEDNCGLGGV